MKNLKDKSGYIMSLSMLCLIIIQRFLPGLEYGPTMDDWFNYGDLYSEKWSQFIIPMQKLSLRPMAGLFDLYVVSPAFEHLWIIKLLTCFMLFAAVYMLYKVLEKNGFSSGGALFLVVCLLPLNTEATYWISASARSVSALFFIALSLMLITRYMETSRKAYLISYMITGLCAVGFCEQAILPYLFLNAYVIFKNGNKKLFIIPIVQVILMAIFYIMHRSSPELAARGSFVKEGILSHIRSTAIAVLQIINSINRRMLSTGFREGVDLLLDGRRIFIAVIAVVSVIFGYFAAVLQDEAEKFNIKKALIAVGVAISGILLFFMLSDSRFTIRSTFFFIVGVGILGGELLLLLPRRVRKWICLLGFSATAFIFTVSGMGIVNQFNTVSAHDIEIADNMIKADTNNDLTNLDKCAYLLDTFSYYSDVNSVECWETVRAACSSYADITGAVRHRLNSVETNNVTPIKDGESVDLSTNLWAKSCSFFALMPDLSVIHLNIEPDGSDFSLFKENGDLYGKIVEDEGNYYRFEKIPVSQ